MLFILVLEEGRMILLSVIIFIMMLMFFAGNNTNLGIFMTALAGVRKPDINACYVGPHATSQQKNYHKNN
jgi:hypothetical protein